MMSKKEKSPKIFDKIVIKRKAFQKILYYGEILKKLTTLDLECMGYLISPISSKNNAINDVVYCLNQEVTEKNAFGNRVGDNETIKAIYAQRSRILGLWHYHASFPPTPSSQDDQMLRFLITQEEKYHEKISKSLDGILVEEDCDKTIILIPDLHQTDERFKITLNSTNLKPNVKYQIGYELNYRISLITNKKNEHYVEVVYQIWDREKEKYQQMIKDKDLKLMLVGPSGDIDMLSLINDVYNHTILNGKIINTYSHIQRKYTNLTKEIESEQKKNEIEAIQKEYANKPLGNTLESLIFNLDSIDINNPKKEDIGLLLEARRTIRDNNIPQQDLKENINNLYHNLKTKIVEKEEEISRYLSSLKSNFLPLESKIITSLGEYNKNKEGVFSKFWRRKILNVPKINPSLVMELGGNYQKVLRFLNNFMIYSKFDTNLDFYKEKANGSIKKIERIFNEEKRRVWTILRSPPSFFKSSITKKDISHINLGNLEHYLKLIGLEDYTNQFRKLFWGAYGNYR